MCDSLLEIKELTLTSLKLRMSVVNVELTTDGLFLTLGKMIPPFRETGFVVLVPFALDETELYCTVLDVFALIVGVDAVDDVEDVDDVDDEDDANVVGGGEDVDG